MKLQKMTGSCQHTRSPHTFTYFTVVFASPEVFFLEGAHCKRDYVKAVCCQKNVSSDEHAGMEQSGREFAVFQLRRASTSRPSFARSRGPYKRSWRAELRGFVEKGEWGNLSEDCTCSAAGDNLIQVDYEMLSSQLLFFPLSVL